MPKLAVFPGILDSPAFIFPVPELKVYVPVKLIGLFYIYFIIPTKIGTTVWGNTEFFFPAIINLNIKTVRHVYLT